MAGGRATRARGAGRRERSRKEIEELIGRQRHARRRPVGRPRPRPAVGHLGAPPRRPVRAAEDWLGPPSHRPSPRPSSTSCAATWARSAPPRRDVARWPAPARVLRGALAASTCGGSAARRATSSSTCPTARSRTRHARAAAPPGHVDASLLVHARRTGFLPRSTARGSSTRRRPQSLPPFTVDGVVAGTWRYEAGRVELEPFERLDAAAMRALREEAAGWPSSTGDESSRPSPSNLYGWESVRDRGAALWPALPFPNGESALSSWAGARRGRSRRWGSQVDDLDAVVAELKRCGVGFEESTCRADDRHGRGRGQLPEQGRKGERAAWFRDSEGNMLGFGSRCAESTAGAQPQVAEGAESTLRRPARTLCSRSSSRSSTPETSVPRSSSAATGSGGRLCTVTMVEPL